MNIIEEKEYKDILRNNIQNLKVKIETAKTQFNAEKFKSDKNSLKTKLLINNMNKDIKKIKQNLNTKESFIQHTHTQLIIIH